MSAKMRGCDGCDCENSLRGCVVQAVVPFVGVIPSNYLSQFQGCAPDIFGADPCGMDDAGCCALKNSETRYLTFRLRVTETDGPTVSAWFEELYEYHPYYGDLWHIKQTDGCDGVGCPEGGTRGCLGCTDCVGLRYEFTLDDDGVCTEYGPVGDPISRCNGLIFDGSASGLAYCGSESGWNLDFTYYKEVWAEGCDPVSGFTHTWEIWLEDPWTKDDVEAASIALAERLLPTPSVPYSTNFKWVKLSGKQVADTDDCDRSITRDDEDGETVAFGRWTYLDLQTLQPPDENGPGGPRVNKLCVQYVRGGMGAGLDDPADVALTYIGADTYTGLNRGMYCGPAVCPNLPCPPRLSVGHWCTPRPGHGGVPCDCDFVAWRRWGPSLWWCSGSGSGGPYPCGDSVPTGVSCFGSSVRAGQIETTRYTKLVLPRNTDCGTAGTRTCDAEVGPVATAVFEFPVPTDPSDIGIAPSSLWGCADDCTATPCPDICFPDDSCKGCKC